MTQQRWFIGALLCGICGSIGMAASDWIMILGDTAYQGSLAWLTIGTSTISFERNAFALALAFIAVALYAIGLLSLSHLMIHTVSRRRYILLTTIGMTPWLCLHLLYLMVFFSYAWLTSQGQPDMGLAVGEALFAQFSWAILIGEAFMVAPFIYVFSLVIRNKTELPRLYCLNNPLLIYVPLKLLSMMIVQTPIGLAFTNGLMSESMLIWFVILLHWSLRMKTKTYPTPGE